MVIHSLKKIDNSQIQMQQFVESTEVDAQVYLAEVMDFVHQVEQPQIKQIILNTFDDEQVKERISKYPAAKTIHHARMGGLIEHICSICKIMNLFLES